MIRIIVTVLFVIQIFSQVTPPVWPPVFQQSFTQSYNATTNKVPGKFYYDETKQAMRIDRLTGQWDPVCGSVLPKVNTYCTHLIRDNKRYIVFPLRRQCCMCCDAQHGCGILKRDWLSTAKYQGQQNISGQSFYKWSIPDGSQTDYYYSTKSAQRIPKRIDTGPGARIQDFTLASYSTQNISDQAFALPDYCRNTCPSSTVCGKFQSEPAIQTE